DRAMLPITAKNLEAARDVLDTTLARVSAEYEEKLAPAIPRVWADAMASIAADLREWLKRMSEEHAWVPAYFELAFGLTDVRAEDPHSSKEPLPIDGGLRLRGSIDLVEKRADGKSLRA